MFAEAFHDAERQRPRRIPPPHRRSIVRARSPNSNGLTRNASNPPARRAGVVLERIGGQRDDRRRHATRLSLEPAQARASPRRRRAPGILRSMRMRSNGARRPRRVGAASRNASRRPGPHDVETEPPQSLLGDQGVDVVVLGEQRAARPAAAGRRGCGAGLVARKLRRQALEQRARAHRLHQPPVEARSDASPEGAALERREQDEALRRACGARGARQPVGRLGRRARNRR